MASFTYTDGSGLTIADDSINSQSINVYGTTGTITNVSVNFTGLLHTWMEDLDMLLVAPDETSNLEFYSDAGASDDFDGDYTFADGGAPIPGSSGSIIVPPGTYGPSAYGSDETDINYGTATGGINHGGPDGTNTFASAFGGASANGIWDIYIVDDEGGVSGSLQAWGVTVTTNSSSAEINGTSAADSIFIASGNATDGAWNFNGDIVVFSGVTGFNLNGFGGADTITGGSGDDTIEGGTGADILNGGANGAGGDTVSFANIGGSTGVTVDMNITTAQTVGGDGDTISNFENIIGSAFADVITASTAGGTIEAAGGNDLIILLGTGTEPSVINGGENADTLRFGAGNSGTYNLTTTSILGIEAFEFVDPLSGGSHNVFLMASQIGGAGISSTTTVDFDGFNDTSETFNIDLAGSNSVDLSGWTFTNNSAPLDGTGAITITGSSTGDVITGSSIADTIDGGGGSDQIFGGAGDDILNGGTGVDTVDGGDGIDTLNFLDATNTQKINLVTNVNIGGFANNDTFLNIENVIGSNTRGDDITGTAGSNTLSGMGADDILRGFNGDDILEGGENNDFLYGGRGADILNGGNGIDWAMYNDADHGVIVDLGGVGSGGIFSSGDTYVSIERVRGSNFDDTITMDGGINKVLGGNGNDIINGLGGKDQLRGGNDDDRINGGADNDTMFGDAGNDIFEFDLGSGADFIADFENDIDTIELDGLLDGGALAGLTAQQVVDTYGIEVSPTRIYLDFGNGDVLKIIGTSPIVLADLYDDVSVV